MSLKVWHSILGTAVAIAGALIFFTDSWDWLALLLALWLMAFFGSNLVFSFLTLARLSEHSLWDLGEYKHHQDFSLAAAKDLWDDERPGSALDLRVKIHGTVRPATPAKAPLSAADASAWRLTVDGFRKTRLGGEGDYTALVDKTWVPRLILEDAGDQATIEPPARLNAGLFREEITTWGGLKHFPEVQTLTMEALTLQSLKIDQFTGLRIRETRIENEPVTVYGTLAKTKEFTLSGNDVAGDSGSLLIVADRAKEKLRFRNRRSPAFWINAGLLVLSLPVAYVAIVGSPLIPRYEGPVQVTPGGQEIQLEFGKPLHIWTFDDKDSRSLVSLTVDDKDYSVAGDQPLTITAYKGEVTQYGPGRDHQLTWNGHWLLDPAHPIASQGRSGLLRFRNLTAKRVTLSFPSNASFSGYTWNLKAHEGQDGSAGNYLTLNRKDLNLPEGTEVKLVSGKNERHLIAGVSPELAWDAGLKAWKIDLADAALKATPSPLWAIPLPTRHLRGVVTDAPNGQSDTFDVPPDPTGRPVVVNSILDDPYSVTDGQLFTLREADARVVYSGPLKNYSGAKWNHDHWEVVVPPQP